MNKTVEITNTWWRKSHHEKNSKRPMEIICDENFIHTFRMEAVFNDSSLDILILLLFSLQLICPYHQTKTRMRDLTGSCAIHLNAGTCNTKSTLQISSAKERKSLAEGIGFAAFNLNIHILKSCMPNIKCLLNIFYFIPWIIWTFWRFLVAFY